MRRNRKPDRIIRSLHLIGVIALEAAAVAGILWLVAARADKSPSSSGHAAPTLRIGQVSGASGSYQSLHVEQP